MKRFYYGIASVAAAASLASAVAFADGLEKDVLFSGKFAGRGETGVTNDLGAEALYFNPAGLAMGRTGVEATADISPTWAHVEAPLTSNGVNVSGNASYDTLYGAFASYGINEHWGIGVASYTGAGAHSEFDNSTFTSVAGSSVTGDIKSRIYDTEVAIGSGYEVLPGLRLGAAWRISHMSADLNNFAYSSATGTAEALQLAGMGQWRYNGFRAGAEYTAPDNSWGLGVNWRSSVAFNMSGTVAGTYSNPALASGASQNFTGGPATLGATLPSQITVGGNYELIAKKLRGYLEYVWTQYHTDQQLNIGGSVTSLLGTASLPNIPLGYNNESDAHVGLECTAVPNWVYRVGYIWTSQVTPNILASPQSFPPGHGNTITFGAGTQLIPDFLELNGAVEYTWLDGDGTGPGVGSTGQYASGEYTAKAYGLHLGATVRF